MSLLPHLTFVWTAASPASASTNFSLPRTPDRSGNGTAEAAGANDPADEATYFFVCKTCGQAVDIRELDQIFHHQIPGHEPMRTDSKSGFTVSSAPASE